MCCSCTSRRFRSPLSHQHSLLQDGQTPISVACSGCAAPAALQGEMAVLLEFGIMVRSPPPLIAWHNRPACLQPGDVDRLACCVLGSLSAIVWSKCCASATVRPSSWLASQPAVTCVEARQTGAATSNGYDYVCVRACTHTLASGLRTPLQGDDEPAEHTNGPSHFNARAMAVFGATAALCEQSSSRIRGRTHALCTTFQSAFRA
jgi:hypothetical protein